MRRRSVVAIAALIAALALAGLPVPAGSMTPSPLRAVEPAAFKTVTIPAIAPASAQGVFDAAYRSAGYLGDGGRLVEPGSAPRSTAVRPRVDQPPTPSGSDWKPAKYTLSGYATFYDNGTTAMRLPRGTVVRICGGGGCIQRTVTDYGPVKKVRVVDMYRPDFFKVCGCPWYSGSTWVTVSVY
jgi:hypothetical protein